LLWNELLPGKSAASRTALIDRVVSWRHSLVADGGAGLIIIGQDGSADAEISVVSRFLFVQSKAAA
jgi:hypothetical protein